MASKPTYEALERRIIELEKKIKKYQRADPLQTASGESAPVNLQIHLLSAIINNTPNVIYVKGTDGRFILVNNNYCQIHNLKKKDVIGKTPLELFPKEIATQYLENDLRIIQSKRPSTFHEQAELSDGLHEYLAVKFPIFDKAGAVIATGGISTDITDRVRTEAMLKAGEKRFRNIIDASPMGIHMYDLSADGRLVFIGANPAADHILGMDHAQIIGKTIEQVFPGLEDTEVPVRYREAAQNGTTWRTEQIDYHRGSIHGAFEVVAFQTEPGKVASLFNDVTARKQAEIALRESEEKLRSIFGAAPIGIGMVSNRKLLDVNQRFCEMTGYSREELVGQDARILYPSDEDYDFVGSEKYKQIKQYGTGTVETRFRRKNGDIIHILMSSTPIDPSDLTSGVTFTALDITRRKQMEKALRDSEKRFRHLSEMLPEAIFETDSDLMLTYANRRAFELFGYAPGEITTINGLELIAPEDRQLAQENMASGITGHDPGTAEYQAVRKDGSVFPVLLHAGSVMKGDQFVGLRGILMDISEQKRAEIEKERIEAQYRQSQKVEAIGRLAGGVAHDLNNLLTPIIGYAEMLMEDFSPRDYHRESLDQIIQAGYGARDLVRQLLAFGRKQTLEYKPLNLNNVIEGFKKLLRRTIREDIALKIIQDPDIEIIKADIGQIEQVIMNLCVNAQDAMPHSGELTLETAMAHLDQLYVSQHAGARAGKHVMLMVSDNGSGMDKNTCEHIFEPFFSTKGDRGTGLGLATVYGIVKQHGGNIWVYSEPGRGTVFKIYLPVADETSKVFHKAETISDGLEGSETILIAEDNDQVRLLAEAILKRRGYTLLSATSGAQSLALLSDHNGPLDLLLTDVVMPDMNGKELYEYTAQLYPDIKVLYMSGYSGNVITHRGILNEGVQFIQKPFTVQGLSAKLREVLQHPK